MTIKGNIVTMTKGGRPKRMPTGWTGDFWVGCLWPPQVFY